MTTKRLSRLRETSAVKKTLLIVSISAHALAASAARAGFQTNIIDCFCDTDTRDLCQKSYLLDDFASLAKEEVIDAINAEFDMEKLDGLVIGSGFELYPDLINRFPIKNRAYANSVKTIQSCTRPELFFSILEKNGILYPEINLSGKLKPGDWLIKRQGDCGGTHIRRLAKAQNFAVGEYQQRYCHGKHYSCVFLANGTKATIIGFSQTWCSSTANGEFSYGGASSILDFDDRQKQEVISIVELLVPDLGLGGLCGMDFIISKTGIVKVLEINPRPTQTVEFFDNDEGSLFTAHLKSFDEQALAIIKPPEMCRAHQVIYANREIQISAGFDWPEWTSDRPKAGSVICKGLPACTVKAEATNSEEVLNQLKMRCSMILERLGN